MEDLNKGIGVNQVLLRPETETPTRVRPFFMVSRSLASGSQGDHGEASSSRKKRSSQPLEPFRETKLSYLALVLHSENKDTLQDSAPHLTIGSQPSSSSGGRDESRSKKTTGKNGLPVRCGRNLNPNLDPRKQKRIMSNRISAQKSRMKKLQYVADMEKKMQALEAQVAFLSPQVEVYKTQLHFLRMEQKRLSHLISNIIHNKIFQDAEIERNRAELMRLRELYMKQHSSDHIQRDQETRLPDAAWNSVPPFNLFGKSDHAEHQPSLGHLSQLNQQQDKGEQQSELAGLVHINFLSRPIEYK